MFKVIATGNPTGLKPITQIIIALSYSDLDWLKVRPAKITIKELPEHEIVLVAAETETMLAEMLQPKGKATITMGESDV